MSARATERDCFKGKKNQTNLAKKQNKTTTTTKQTNKQAKLLRRSGRKSLAFGVKSEASEFTNISYNRDLSLI